jgi:hypothetical protein
VLVAALFHASANIAGAAIPTWTTEPGRWINFALLLAVAAAVTWRFGWQRLAMGSEGQSPGQPPASGDRPDGR